MSLHSAPKDHAVASLPEGDDYACVQAALRGEVAAFERLYDRHKRMVYDLCLRYTADVAEANDALQDCFLRAYERLAQFKGEGLFAAWLRRLAVRLLINKLKQTGTLRFRKFSLTQETEELPSSEMTSPDRMAYEELLALLQQLPVGYRTVFSLYAIEGYSHQEIAQMLNISVGTSHSQLSKARKHMANLLGGQPL